MGTVIPQPYSNNAKNTWCPGCGNFGILTALKNTFIKLQAKPEDVVLVGDIGCSSKLPYYVQTYSFGGLHGRVIPIASGIKLTNHLLTVIAVGGDGGIYGEGGNHLIHAARRNINITVFVHDNKVYALTKGQTSPTSDQGYKSDITPEGFREKPFNPLLISLASGASFVARGFADQPDVLTSIMVEAIMHPGFALVEILQPCVSFNKINTGEWYRQRLYALQDESGYDVNDLAWALHKTQEWGDRIPMGIFYREERPTYESQLPAINEKPLKDQNIERIDISSLLSTYR